MTQDIVWQEIMKIISSLNKDLIVKPPIFIINKNILSKSSIPAKFGGEVGNGDEAPFEGRERELLGCRGALAAPPFALAVSIFGSLLFTFEIQYFGKNKRKK